MALGYDDLFPKGDELNPLIGAASAVKLLAEIGSAPPPLAPADRVSARIRRSAVALMDTFAHSVAPGALGYLQVDPFRELGGCRRDAVFLLGGAPLNPAEQGRCGANRVSA